MNDAKSWSVWNYLLCQSACRWLGCGFRWVTGKKCLMMMFACCLFEGIVSIVMMVADGECDTV